MIDNGWYKRNNGSDAIIQVVGQHESGDALCIWAFGGGNPFRYHSYEFSKEFDKVTEEYVNNVERQCCPEHGYVPQVMAHSVDLDKNPFPDYWRKDVHNNRTCSFCGSIHPDDYINAIKEHGFGISERTTKSYKVYVNIPGAEMYKYYRYHDNQYGSFVDKYNALVDEYYKKKDDTN